MFPIGKNTLLPVGEKIVEEYSKLATDAHTSEPVAEDSSIYLVKGFCKVKINTICIVAFLQDGKDLVMVFQ